MDVTNKKDNSLCSRATLRRILQLKPAWSLIAAMRVADVPFVVENVESLTALDRTTPVTILDHDILEVDEAINDILKPTCDQDEFLASFIRNEMIRPLDELDRLTHEHSLQLFKHSKYWTYATYKIKCGFQYFFDNSKTQCRIELLKRRLSAAYSKMEDYVSQEYRIQGKDDQTVYQKSEVLLMGHLLDALNSTSLLANITTKPSFSSTSKSSMSSTMLLNHGKLVEFASKAVERWFIADFENLKNSDFANVTSTTASTSSTSSAWPRAANQAIIDNRFFRGSNMAQFEQIASKLRDSSNSVKSALFTTEDMFPTTLLTQDRAAACSLRFSLHWGLLSSVFHAFTAVKNLVTKRHHHNENESESNATTSPSSQPQLSLSACSSGESECVLLSWEGCALSVAIVAYMAAYLATRGRLAAPTLPA